MNLFDQQPNIQSEKSTFNVYNASAGSGKTFTLVKEYLKIILQSDSPYKFQNILAVTFTNKAAAEMKTRILDKLILFSEHDAVKDDDLLKVIIKETDLSKYIIRDRSKKTLNAILKNYSAFSITTIDSFTHKIIRNFAYDLGLSLNFEVELDPTELLSEAVDILISKIGTDKQLTKTLIDFTLEKVDDDRSWDISKELNEFSKLLLNENDAEQFKSLKTKKLEDFYQLRKKLKELQKQTDVKLKEIGKSIIELIDSSGLIHKNFTRSSVPNFFNNLKNKGVSFDVLNYSNTIEKAINEHKFYNKSANEFIQSTIEGIIPEITTKFWECKSIYSDLILIKLSLKSIIPLAVLNKVNSELIHLKEENNIQLNAEFNQLISESIKDQPAPFIYERLGQRYTHYFIDEMQDTSVLQWQNIIPLMENALAQSNSSLMLVGDGKQAIYRWRGGKAEQFIDLGTQEGSNPFSTEKSVNKLDTNFRSYSEIINFTNNFFQFTANYINNKSYKELFISGNKQLENSKKGGYVSINFLQEETDKEENTIKYAKAVFERIKKLDEQGFKREDTCILVRTKKEGVTIASYLTERNVAIISSETLILSNSSKVNFVINLIYTIVNPNNQEARFNFLYYLSEHLNIDTNKHSFLNQLIKMNIYELFKELKSFNINIDVAKFEQLPLYEKVEYIIRELNLIKTSDAYLQYFLDVVLEQQQRGNDLENFLEFWELRKDKLSISISDGANKVNIMTIHKSKGLEFPVVVFPCDLRIYNQINPKIWFDELPETYNGFNKLLLNQSKNFEFINEKSALLNKQTREELELDNFNMLYVALTRPIKQLHIITDGKEKKDCYSTIFRQYTVNVKDDISKTFPSENENIISFGTQEHHTKLENNKGTNSEEMNEFLSNSMDTHTIQLLPSSSKLWDTERGEAISYGNIVHEILSRIYTKKDVDSAIQKFYNQGKIGGNKINDLTKIIINIINHPELNQYFKTENQIIYNERQLINENGNIIIPDKLIINGGNTTIVDYKTGFFREEHKKQLISYEKILRKMGFYIINKILIYISDESKEIKIKSF